MSRNAQRRKALIDDGMNSEWVWDAIFDGILEIPRIEKPEKLHVPVRLVPFSKRKYGNSDDGLVFYEHDRAFASVLANPEEFVEEFRHFQVVVSLDCSLYRDMPLSAQIANVYRSRAFGFHLQKHYGITVIPNVRWGDERTFTTIELPEKIAFLGVPKESIVSIGSYGCVRGRENTNYFKAGLAAMLEELQPKIVFVYGSMPPNTFAEFKNDTRFIPYPDWATICHSDRGLSY